MNEKLFLCLIPIYILYIVFLGLLMFRRRMSALRSKAIPFEYLKTYQTQAPESLRVVQNHFTNQFEVPILFFITCLAAVILKAATPLTFTLGCLFILSRMWHSFIHLGSNHLSSRASVYFAGILLILAMWIVILVS